MEHKIVHNGIALETWGYNGAIVKLSYFVPTKQLSIVNPHYSLWVEYKDHKSGEITYPDDSNPRWKDSTYEVIDKWIDSIKNQE